MIRLYGHHMPREVFDARVSTIMGIILDLSVRLLRLQVPVVLDCGFWTRASRATARERLREAGAHTVLHYFDVPDSELRNRLARRNATPDPGVFEITPAMFDTFSEQFEAPGEDEDDLVIECAA
jgi:predicted kinase